MAADKLLEKVLKLADEKGGIDKLTSDQRDKFYSDWLRAVAVENLDLQQKKYTDLEEEARSRIAEADREEELCP